MNAQQLKNSILQEAIEGRLVPQDPNDEPASVLLDKIRKEKARLVKDGKLKKKDLEETPISEDEKPFEIPESWEWVRLSCISKTITKGTTPRGGKVAYSSVGIGFLRAENIAGIDKLDLSSVKYVTDEEHRGYLSRSILEANDLLITIAGTLGRTALVRESDLPLNANQAVSLVRLVDAKVLSLLYIIYALNAPSVQETLTTQKKVTAIPNLTLEIIGNCIIPLPPLSEQQRIVAKIEELLPKVEEYGKAQEALNKLNEELPERLKKSILQEAITGRLVPQDPNDEPASVLLDKIRAEKKQLVKEGKLKKKDLEETPISEDEKPFDIPKHWGLVRLGEITYNHGQKTPTEEFSYIDIGSIDNEHQKLNMTDNIIKAKDAPSRARKIVKRGDVLYATVRPYLHNLCIIDRDFDKEPIASTGFAVLSCINGVYNKFLFYYLLSPVFDAYANDGDNAKGMAYPAINDKKLYNGLVPIPPLAEQKRIVAKIEQLMKEIDKLKA